MFLNLCAKLENVTSKSKTVPLQKRFVPYKLQQNILAKYKVSPQNIWRIQGKTKYKAYVFVNGVRVFIRFKMKQIKFKIYEIVNVNFTQY